MGMLGEDNPGKELPPDGAEGLLKEGRAVILRFGMNYVPTREEEPELIAGRPVVAPEEYYGPLMGQMLRMHVETKNTEVHLSVMRDGEVAVTIERNGQLISQIDIDPEEGVPTMRNPNCTCSVCNERRARTEKKH